MKYIRPILTITGAILVGAVGSGVWQHILEPSLAFSRDLILNITTLGLENYKNIVYLDIAEGFHEDSSHRILIILWQFTAFSAIFFVAILYSIYSFIKRLIADRYDKSEKFFNVLIKDLQNQNVINFFKWYTTFAENLGNGAIAK